MIYTRTEEFGELRTFNTKYYAFYFKIAETEELCCVHIHNSGKVSTSFVSFGTIKDYTK